MSVVTQLVIRGALQHHNVLREASESRTFVKLEFHQLSMEEPQDKSPIIIVRSQILTNG